MKKRDSPKEWEEFVWFCLSFSFALLFLWRELSFHDIFKYRCLRRRPFFSTFSVMNFLCGIWGQSRMKRKLEVTNKESWGSKTRARIFPFYCWPKQIDLRKIFIFSTSKIFMRFQVQGWNSMSMKTKQTSKYFFKQPNCKEALKNSHFPFLMTLNYSLTFVESSLSHLRVVRGKSNGLKRFKKPA